MTITKQGKLAPSTENLEDMAEETRPRKRGRPAMTESPPQPAAAEHEESSQGTKRKRGRPSQAETQLAGPSLENGTIARADQAQPNNQPKKAGRPRKDAKEKEASAHEADDENEGDSSFLRRSGRERRSSGDGQKTTQDAVDAVDKPSQRRLKKATLAAGSVEAENQPEPPPKKKRGRPSLNGETSKVAEEGQERQPGTKQPQRSKVPARVEQPSDEAEGEPTTKTKKKRGRPSLNSDEGVEKEDGPESQPKARRRGRPSAGDEAEDATEESSKPKQKKSRARPPEVQEAPIQEDAPRRGRPRQSDTAPSVPKRRKRSPPTQPASRSPSPDLAPDYQHITTLTRRVPRSTIDEKWSPLDPPSISSITSLLSSASRPVLLRLSNRQKHAHANIALNAVAKRLQIKFTRGLPFPPPVTAGRREDELEYERTVTGIQALEAQLDPLLHSVELLKREREKAQRELDREYRILNTLGNNARAEARERRGQLRKMHALVPERRNGESHDDEKKDLLPVADGAGTAFKDLEGQDELFDLAGQLGNHMESMRTNLQQIEGVDAEIVKSRGALRAALTPHLEGEALDRIVLG
jgi:hypothetical protein